MRTGFLILAMMLVGCATQPLTYEQQQALMAMSVGLQNAGNQMQADARARMYQAQQWQYTPVQMPVYHQYNVRPAFQPIPVGGQMMNTGGYTITGY
jgi:hypothetical protein